MEKLITYVTLVTLVCIVGGQRVEIPPGNPVPDSLDETDIEALLASGSIEREDAGEIEMRQKDIAARETQGDFAKEKARILAERQANQDAAASVVAAAAGTGTGTGTPEGTGGGAAAKTTAKTTGKART